MEKKKNIYNLIIFTCTMIFLIYNFISNRLFFRDMFAFEFIYLTCTAVFFLIPNKSFNLPCIILRITGFVRYVIFPVLVYHKNARQFYFEPNVRIIMIIEVLLVHVVILFYYQSRVYRKKLRLMESSNNGSGTNLIPMRLGLTTVIVSVVGLLISLQNPMLLKNYLVFSFSEKNTSGLGGGAAILFQISVFFAFIYILSLIKRNHFFPNYIKILVSFAIIVIYANGTGVTAANVSRWRVLVSLLTGVTFVFCLYPEAKKAASFITILIVPLVILASTLLKQEMWGTAAGGLESVLSPGSINGYFAGSFNVEKGLALLDTVKIDRAKTIFVDTFANFPMLNHFVDISETTATHFNRVFYGSNIARDQICPMIIQFMEYLGVFGVAAYGFVVFLGLHFYTISATKSSLLEKNIFIILTFYFSLVYCLNWSILLEVIWIQVLPLALVNYFNIKLKSRGVASE